MDPFDHVRNHNGPLLDMLPVQRTCRVPWRKRNRQIMRAIYPYPKIKGN